MFFTNPYTIWNPYLFHNSSFCFPPPSLLEHHHSIPPNQPLVVANVFQLETPQQAKQLEKDQEKSVKIQQNLQRAQSYNEKKITSFQSLASRNLKKTIKNHNVLPNVVNIILSHLRRRTKTGKKVEKIMSKYRPGEEITKEMLAKYYAYQNYLHSKIPKSKHENSLRFIINHFDPALDAFTSQEQLFYNKVCRTLILHLLQEQFFLSFLTNRKCNKSSKADHLRAKFFITALLKERVSSLHFFKK